MATSEADIAAQLIERLLGDPAFRTEFRRDPAAACRKAGLDELADEMSMGAGKAMMTLDQRESKSSLAGVMMAAAMEGVGVYQFGEHILPHIDDVPSAVGDVLSRVSLPAIDLKGALAGAPDAPAAAPPADAAGNGAAGAAEAGAPGGGGGGGAAAAAAEEPPPAAPPEAAAAAGDKAAAAKAAAVPPEQAAASKAAAKIAAAESPEAKRAAEIDDAVAKIKDEAKDLPDGSSVPDGPVAPQEVEEVGSSGHDHGDEAAAAAPAQPAATAPAPPAAVETPEAAAAQPAAPAAAVEAAAGSGGGGSAAEALLENKNLVLDADAQKDLRDGVVDPRLVGLLGKLTEKHKIELSVIKTGHAQFTSGGSVSNHFEGRGIDIAKVDGEIVDAGSPAARELASEIAEMTGDLRPTEVGTPWAIGASGFFTDGGHQDHLHVAFDGEPPAGFQPPAPAAAPAAAASAVPAAPAAAASSAAAPGQPAAAAAAAEPPKKGDSLSFRAVTAEDAAKAAKGGDELGFMQPPAGPPSAVADAATSPAVVADAATATAGGSSGLGAAALETAKAELAKGVHETGVNTGAEVDQYLKAAGVGPGNPWCASFVTWALEQNGHKMPGSGWAAVQTWVRNAEAGNNNLEIVSAEDARPGDIVAYDWGHDEDFAADGHIGFVASNVENGKFTALEGNNQDRVMTVPRDTSQANVKFIRIKGDAPAGAAAPSAPLAPPPGGAPAPPAAVESGGGSSQPAPPAAVEPSGGGGAAEAAGAALDAGGANPYPGDDAPKEQIAAWMAREAQKRGLPPQLPLMASLVESGMTNIQGGDADSVGFFQMRVGIWNQGDYAGYPKKPELQVKWFLDQAEQVKKARVAAGKPIDDPNSFGDWIADVERPAEQYRGRYQLKLGEANDLLGKAGTAPPVAAAAAAPAPGQPVAAAAAAAEPKAKPGDSLSFRAVTAEDAAKAAKGGDSDELGFMKPPAGPASAVADAATTPAIVANAAAATAGGSSGLGAAALDIAKGELAKGVHEEGVNTGKEVDQYLAAAGVGPGNPWCASFVTWSLEKAGHKMDGGGWAGVQTWVRAAEAKTHDLQIVDAADARPGDIVVYDWGGQEDFGADGHIGFLASNVEGDKFTAVEGNNQDAVTSVPRSTTQANVKFIRIGGSGSVPAGTPVPGAVTPAPGAPAPPAAVESGGGSSQPAPPAAVEPSGGGGAAEVAGAAVDAGGANPYPGDDAPKEQIAAWMAREAEKRGLPKQLPLMASLVESGMTNIQGGDADSVGFFQMRVGIWNQGAYAGYPDKPELQVKWFLDQAEQVKKARIAAGKPIDDPNSFGEWIADVERPAEQYRGRYQLKLEEANSLLGGAASAPPVAAAASAPAAAPAAVAEQASGPKKPRGDELQFMSAKAEEASARKHHATVQFMKAIGSDQAGAPAAPAAAPAVASAAAAPAPGGPVSPTAAEDAAANQAVGAPVPEGELALQNVGPIGTYPGDDAGQAQLAQWLAAEAKKAGLPPELPVMASLVESGVKNLKGGDADSAGFFQMRVGIWDNGPYKGFRMNPNLQAKWFIDNALAVKKARLAAGKSVTDPGSFGEWIADVERPAAQYRYKYQLRLTEARKLISGR